MDERPIGLFDSGAGGLTIWRALRRLLPAESCLYLADTANAPYGLRSSIEVQDLAARNAALLIECGAKLIVVACNTASVHALHHLRARYPGTPFVGVVPVVKTLARRTRTGVAAVLATPATAASGYLEALCAVHAADITMHIVPCPGLAEAIETGNRDGVSTLLERQLVPLRASGADAVGLGCTHYPLVKPAIKRVLGPGVRVYEPSRPVARRVRTVLAERDALARHPEPAHRFLTTGDPAPFAALLTRILRGPAYAVEYAAS